MVVCLFNIAVQLEHRLRQYLQLSLLTITPYHQVTSMYSVAIAIKLCIIMVM